LQLANDLIAHEKLVMPGTVTYVAAYGYNDDAEKAQAVWSHDFTVPGPPPAGTRPAGGHTMSGDQAAMISWRTSRKNARGKWIYLRKYIHSGAISDTDIDELDTNYQILLGALVNELSPAGGAFWGGIRSRTHADNITATSVSKWVTTRSLKRRGKRPLPNP
jgi:hypothetical protein